jgi:uncharacterized protein (DUF1330 family)
MKKIHRSLAPLLLLLLVSPSLMAQETSAPEGLDWLAQTDLEGPVTVMDVVKFKPSGEESYDKYDALAEAKLKSLGGEVIFRGYSKPAGRLDSSSWDRVTMRKYPSAKAVVEMGSSSEYRAAFPHRMQGVEKSLVYAFGGNAMPRVAAAASSDTVYMLNLLRFNDNGGVAGYSDYGSHVGPLIQQAGGRPVLRMNGLTAIISEEEYDMMILVMYPSPDSFFSMVTSPEYRAISHKRGDSIELGQLFSFSDHR